MVKVNTPLTLEFLTPFLPLDNSIDIYIRRHAICNMKISNNTNWNLYRNFIVVFETGSYAKSADVLSVSRPAVSQSMKELGRQLGVKLFLSHPTGVTPTHEATILYNRIVSIVTKLQYAERDLSEFNPDTPVTLRIVVPATLASSVLVPFFKEFYSKHPNIKLEFYNRASEETYKLFADKKVDVVIDLEESVMNSEFQKFPLLTTKQIFCASKQFLKENNLSEEVTLEQLAGLPIICHKHHRKDLGELGLAESVYLTTATLEPILPMVEKGVGVGVYPSQYLVFKEDYKGIVQLRIEGVDVISETKLVYGYKIESFSLGIKLFTAELEKFVHLFNSRKSRESI